MGTHPIFESDFDCLTEKFEIRQTKIGLYQNGAMLPLCASARPCHLAANNGTVAEVEKVRAGKATGGGEVAEKV